MTTPRPGLRACFDALVDLAEPERAAWLDAHDVDDATRDRLAKMLAADGVDDASVPLLRAGAAAVATEFTPEADEGAGLVGTSIGPYRLAAILGHGGTSVVFRAERPMGEGVQTVALKVLRTGLYSADSQRRFRREQGVLSQLSHPNIASLVDGGISAGGIPYIATEYVDGLPITGYANANALDLDARLRLVVAVCRAVNSAHRALVVHRDLKPSNVLVSRDGVAKVLDFGIAQLLDDGSGGPAQTQVIALTPGYAAPEQYRPGPVTTATDVYALGVLLGELLTGRPVTTGSLAGVSRQFADAPAGLPPVPALRRLLHGDLEAIHATACAPEPERRYGSVALLADDIERYLRKLPVMARAPSVPYRLRKYVQRHWIGASAATLSLAAVVIGVSATLWQARVAQEEGRRATAVSNFLMGLFEASMPGQLPEQRLTLEDVVHRAGDRLQTETDLSAPTRIDMLRMLAEVSMAASDFTQATRLIDQATALGDATYAPGSPVLLRIRLLRAHLMIFQSRYAEAAAAYESILPQIQKLPGQAGIRALQNYAQALMYSARAEQALAVSAQAMRMASDVHGADSQAAVLAMLEHGDLLLGAGRTTDSVATIEPALRHWRAQGWPPARDFLRGLLQLARARYALGEIDAAKALVREDIAKAERIYQAPHEQIARGLLNLGEMLVTQENLDEAAPLLTRSLAMFRAVYGEGHMRGANTLTLVGFERWRRRDFAAADDAIREGQQWCARPGLHATRTCVALDAEETRLALAQGDLRRADAGSARGLAMSREIFRDGGGATADLLQLRAAVQQDGGDAAAALASCDAARAMLGPAGESEGPIAVAVLARRAAVLEGVHRVPEAIADIRHALALWQRMAPDGWRRRAEMLAQLARLQAASGDAAAAKATAASALAALPREAEIDPAALAVLKRQ